MATKKKQPRSVRMLFVGNSFTQRNNLPELLAELALPHGIAIEHTLISRGGASLRTHWNAGAAKEAIEAGGYDYVVLQEQSTLPIKNAKRMAENIRLFAEVVKTAGGTLVLYMTWARKNASQSQQAITTAYREIGAEVGAQVVPVGTVWEALLSKQDQPVLHDRDQSHPTPAGSYLAACVFLASLFHRSPVGIEAGPPKLSPEDRRLLQEIAWRECGVP